MLVKLKLGLQFNLNTINNYFLSKILSIQQCLKNQNDSKGNIKRSNVLIIIFFIYIIMLLFFDEYPFRIAIFIKLTTMDSSNAD